MIGLVLLAGQGFSQTIKIASPDNKVQATVRAGSGEKEIAIYTLWYRGKTVLNNSVIGFESSGQSTGKYKLSSKKENSVSTTWQTVYGERKIVPENYKQVTLVFKHESDPERSVEVEIRAYNEGFAFRYNLKNNGENIEITEDHSSFSMPADATAWASKMAQSPLYQVKVSQLKEIVDRPLTVKINNSLYTSIGEAGLVDFSRMKFERKQGSVITAKLDGPAKFKDSARSPWRFLLLGNSPAELLEKNYLVLNLNEPNKIPDTKWIQPGSILREPTLTTVGAYESIDFAAAHNIKYIIFDAGWYGREDSDSSDATRVSHDPRRYAGPLDLHKVIDYGNSKNIGVVLYVNRRALERQLDTLLPLYKAWGVKGLKFGFVNVGSQEWTTWLHEAIRKAADYQMIVDVHDEYRPTGYSRTYPNLLTQEGIRGDEESPFTEHSITTMFTRMIAGAGDNTICYFNNRVNRVSSHVSQMAKSVCIYSPLQFLYWYDKPAPGKTSNFKEGEIQPIEDIKWFDSLQVVFDRTLVLEGDMEKFITIAREKNSTWFIGSLNGITQRKLQLKFDFLDKDRLYFATIYTDDSTLGTTTNVRIEKKIVDAKTILNFNIAPRNGVAIRITPVAQSLSVRVVQDDQDWSYEKGDKVSFRIYPEINGKPVSDAKLHIELGKEKMKPFLVIDTIFRNGNGTIEGTLSEPGFLRLVVTAEQDGKKYRTISTAAFSPNAITPAAKNPDDFVAYWNKEIGSMKSLPLNSTMKFLPSLSTKNIHSFEVSFQGSQPGSKVYGILSKPAAPGKYPAILKVPGAGIRSYSGDTAMASKGIITLEIGIHGIPVTMENKVYNDLASGPLRNYNSMNMEDKNSYYYHRVYLNNIRAIDFLISDPSVDSSRIGVFGGSQGGALSIVAAALDKRIKFLGSLYPALSDLTGYLQNRAGGWPHLFTENAPANLKTENKINTSYYYDVVNFARLINVPGWYSFGYNDEVCPPTSIYAAYNVIPAKKDLYLDLPSGHWMTNAQKEEWYKWLEKSVLSKTSAKSTTPLMGWSSWYPFIDRINEKMIMETADSMVSKGLREKGYNILQLDDGWMAAERDHLGRQYADKKRFPRGMKFLADYLHERGLKLGIYSSSGALTCAGYPGSYNHEEIDAATYAEWGVDYLKYDACGDKGNHKDPYLFNKMHQALKKTGRDILFNICIFYSDTTHLWGNKIGDTWRTGGDIVKHIDKYPAVTYKNWYENLQQVIGKEDYSGSGHWNDPDNLIIGYNKNNQQTLEEQKAQFSFWAMVNAPLFLGNDVRDISKEIFNIITHEEIIGINQDALGKQAKRVHSDPKHEIWLKPLSGNNFAILVFNRTTEKIIVEIDLKMLGLEDNYKVRDSWKRKDLGSFSNKLGVELAAHEAIILKLDS
ncbi:MAG: glycoside hydrolase family 97 N-terminal domain-containing protein [Flavitalea sp.]